ncbi:MAG: MarC family protein [Deltaproteobacteria bacterium]
MNFVDFTAEFAAFATLFVVIDPIAVAPLFMTLTRNMEPAQRRAAALRACLVAAAVLTVFGLIGDKLLQFLGISLNSFRISGGILLFIIAAEMLFEKRTERRTSNTHASHDPSVFPIAVPLVAGPGAMATMVLLSAQEGGGWEWIVSIHVVMLSVLLITFAMFLIGAKIDKLFGKNGINVLTRLFGILLAALAVQIVLDGLGGFGLKPVGE